MNSPPPVRPRLLLADDHHAFLESVSRLLAGTFDIVALAADGRQALDLASRLRPDVVVLDIAMPGFDGFQTLERLRRDNPETRVVFLTMQQDDAFVSTAINAGAGAIDHALAGRLFVPSLTSLSTVAGSRHTVQFHANDRHNLDEISQLVAATLRSGEPVVLVTTETTRTGVAQRLQARQIDLAILAQRGQYVAHDSALILSYVMREGRPDQDRLAEMVHGLDRWRLAVPNKRGSRLTIIGDMSACLCQQGAFDAALDLERLWHDLTRALPFFTVCSYPIDCLENSAALNLRSNLCAAHHAVASGPSRAARAT